MDISGLGNYNMRCGRVGHVDQVNIALVQPGDRLGFQYSGVFRMSPWRKNVSIDPIVDIMSFYVPMRHIYSNWEDFITGGPGGGVTLASVSESDLRVTTASPDTAVCYWVPWQRSGAAYPKWAVEPYRLIWNRYFRAQKAGVAEKSFGSLVPNDLYGFPAARLPSVWSLIHENTSVDDEVASATTVKLTDIAQKMADYKRDQQAEWFLSFYDDYVRGVFGGATDTDADQRPTILAHDTFSASGFNIYGTAADSEGSSIGRSEVALNHGFPRRFFPEHGVVVTMMVVRMVELVASENPWLMSRPNPTYDEFAGDPTVLGDTPPQAVVLNEFFNYPSATGVGYLPAGHQHMYNAPTVHPFFMDTEGFSKGWPIRENAPTTLYEAAMCGNAGGVDSNFSNSDYFLGQQLLDWNYFGRCDVTGFRGAPDPTSSIYAGADLNQG